jgi:hypothetical protein
VLTVHDPVGERVVQIEGRGRAAWYVRELAAPVAAATLTWRWRVGVHPAGADLAREATDDAALRVFVVFARHSRFARTPRTIFYTALPPGAPAVDRRSFGSDALRVVGLAPTGARGAWHDVVVRPADDYARRFGGESPPVVAIGFMQDTDQTGAFASAALASLCIAGGPERMRLEPTAARPG